MPAYDYFCQKCEQIVTITQKMGSSEIFVCPICNSVGLKRVFSQVAVVKSGLDRVRDVSWIDQSLKAKVGKYSRKP
jgi:putative FmdB family regulatory protein